jgi:hypothetical protein
MSDLKEIKIDIKPDHLERLTKASAYEALEELIWNALDADAQFIDIKANENGMGGYDKLVIEDDGHGIRFEELEQAFGSLGGSPKSYKSHSPKGRALHGKYGQGRFKAFALGNLIEIVTYAFTEDGETQRSDIHWDRNRISQPRIGSQAVSDEQKRSGTTIAIKNCDQKKIHQLFRQETIDRLGFSLAAYLLNYPRIAIQIQGQSLNFRDFLQAEELENFSVTSEGREIIGKLRLILWDEKHQPNQLCLCEPNGFLLKTLNLNLKKTQGLGISAYLLSEYCSELNDRLLEMDVNWIPIQEEIRKQTSAFLQRQIEKRRQKFIKGLQDERVYPTKFTNIDEGDELLILEKKVFDVVAYSVSETDATFNKKKEKEKKTVLELILLALENGDESLRHVLVEILNLPPAKVTELSDLLKATSLTNLIETAKMVSDRLKLIYDLEKLLLIGNSSYINMSERKQFHRIIVDNTWLFGEEFALGGDDVSLKSVLRNYLNYLGRTDFEAIIENTDSSDLRDIPDICLFSQFSLGDQDRFRNLVIELKRPSKTITMEEIDQIKRYAREVAKSSVYPKEKTEWIFLLMATKTNEEAKAEANQADRPPGVVYISNDSKITCKLVEWGSLLSQAKARHKFVQDKLKIRLAENPGDLDFIKNQYSQLFEN